MCFTVYLVFAMHVIMYSAGEYHGSALHKLINYHYESQKYVATAIFIYYIVCLSGNGTVKIHFEISRAIDRQL